MIKFGKFIGQVRTEMKKVSWPSKQELLSSTLVVLVSTMILAAFIGMCDLVLSRIINFLIRGVF
ncbi:MAG: preprotein translocase subunit SecE [Candidatus Omnitrophota bacterium]|nr:preprotein translocase subunit SecE [Candidatus Omnitrophota bacterium]